MSQQIVEMIDTDTGCMSKELWVDHPLVAVSDPLQNARLHWAHFHLTLSGRVHQMNSGRKKNQRIVFHCCYHFRNNPKGGGVPHRGVPQKCVRGCALSATVHSGHVLKFFLYIRLQKPGISIRSQYRIRIHARPRCVWKRYPPPRHPPLLEAVPEGYPSTVPPLVNIFLIK